MGKELQLCSAVGWAWQKEEQVEEDGEEEYEAVASVLPGFVIKRYATLHLKCVGFVSFLLFSPKKEYVSPDLAA